MSEVKRDHLARVIIDTCTLEHSDFPGTIFNLVDDGEPVQTAENGVIQFQLNQVILTLKNSQRFDRRSHHLYHYSHLAIWIEMLG